MPLSGARVGIHNPSHTDLCEVRAGYPALLAPPNPTPDLCEVSTQLPLHLPKHLCPTLLPLARQAFVSIWSSAASSLLESLLPKAFLVLPVGPVSGPVSWANGGSCGSRPYNQGTHPEGWGQPHSSRSHSVTTLELPVLQALCAGPWPCRSPAQVGPACPGRPGGLPCSVLGQPGPPSGPQWG